MRRTSPTFSTQCASWTRWVFDQKIVGILHDVIEKNSQWSLSRLEDEGFKSKIIEAVDAMTRRVGESYEDFVSRAADNPISRSVKIADLKDNIQMARLCSKYQKALNRVLIGRLSP